MVLNYTAGATCARISSLDAVRTARAVRTMRRSSLASVIHGRPEPSLRGGNVPHTTAESSDTPIHCVQHVQQHVEMPTSFPHAYNATPFKWLKLFNRSTLCRCTFWVLFCKRIHAEGCWSAEFETRNFVLRIYRSLWAALSSVIDVVRDALLCL